jgi:proliferating cell nuclear antigen PCNA
MTELVKVVITEPGPFKRTIDCIREILVDGVLTFSSGTKKNTKSKKKTSSDDDSEKDDDSDSEEERKPKKGKKSKMAGSESDSDSDEPKKSKKKGKKASSGSDSDSDSEKAKKGKKKGKKASSGSDSDSEKAKKGKKKGKKASSGSDSDSEKAKKGKKKGKKASSDSDTKAKKNKKSEKDNNGMIKLMEINSARSVMVYMKLMGKAFNKFHCQPDELSIGVDFQNFYKLLKPVDKDDILTLVIRSDAMDKLFIYVKKPKMKRSEYTLTLIEPHENKLKYDKVDFDSMLSIASSELYDVCRNMKNVSEYVQIKSVGKEISFCCKGDFGTMNEIYGNNDGSKNQPVAQGIYELKHLYTSTKCAALCDETEIFMKNNYPAVFKYATAGFGEISFWVSPINLKPQQNADEELSDLSDSDDDADESKHTKPDDKAKAKVPRVSRS